MHIDIFVCIPVGIACVASVSLGLSASWRRFSLFGCAKIGASATLMEAAGRGRGGEKRKLSPFPSPSTHFFCARPNFPAARKKRKVHRTCGKPYRNACYAGYRWYFCNDVNRQ